MPRFIAALEAAGASPYRVPAYETRPAAGGAAAAAPEAALMRAGVIDAIVFTSAAEAQGLVLALEGADVVRGLVADHGAHSAHALMCDLLVRQQSCATLKTPGCMHTGGFERACG